MTTTEIVERVRIFADGSVTIVGDDINAEGNATDRVFGYMERNKLDPLDVAQALYFPADAAERRIRAAIVRIVARADAQ